MDRVSWRHSRIDAFYQKHVAPFEKILGTSGYLKSISTLLAILDAHGDCPSVVQIQQDHEYQALQNVYDLLSRITLLDHSLNVAEQMIADVARSKTRDPEMIMGKILVAALGHDIGKIPDLMEGENYRKGDHPYISYLVLKNAIFTETSPQHEDILSAVKSHHFQIREGFTHDLRKADQAAREREAEQLSLRGESATPLIQVLQEQAVLEAKPQEINHTLKDKGTAPETIDLSWLDLDEFLTLIEPEINRVENNTYFKAFSMNNGLVYLMLNLVSETVLLLAKRHNHLEVLVNADTTEKKRSLEFTVKTLLADKGYIPSFIGKGFSGARFGLIDASGRKKLVGVYMPVEARAFQTSLADLEERKNKNNIIKEIIEVRPLVGQKK
ncbi:MAG: HD domain-containing protein [Desulfosalsimonadaceae bacterium]